MSRTNPGQIEDQKAATLTKAALEAARFLGLSPSDTALILGVPQGALAAMKKGDRGVDGVNGEAERADAVVRLVKRLKSRLGDNESLARAWIRRESTQLGDKPLALMLQKDGILRIAQHAERTEDL